MTSRAILEADEPYPPHERESSSDTAMVHGEMRLGPERRMADQCAVRRTLGVERYAPARIWDRRNADAYARPSTFIKAAFFG